MSHSLSLPLQSVSAVLTLLNEGCTIPFISRYRKERTGGLDEVQITDISELYDRLKELGKRKETILKTIREQERLTPELEAKIRVCMDSTELEDIYLPYKPKRRTRAQIAREQGLEPLALAIMEEAKKPTAPPDLPEGGGDKLASILQKYQGRAKESLSSRVRIGTPPLSGRSGGAPLPLSGESEGALALDIIAEIVSENQQARNTVRTAYQRGAVITSKVIKKMKDTEEAQKFADYFDFSEPLRRCNSHRLLAMRRGEAQGILRVSITIDGEECITRLTRQFVRGQGVCQTLVSQAVEDSFKRLINPSIENEFATLSKERADEEAIKVFSENLRQLLLSPPLGQKRVLALDPGFANGCKIACLDEQGNLLHHEIIYPHPPRNQVRQATEALQRMINTYKIEAIAIGNGTASRESKEFVENITTETTAGPSPSPLPHREGSDYRHLPKSKQQFTDNASPNFAKQIDNYHNPNSKPQSAGHTTPLPLGEGSGEGPVGPVGSASSLFIFLVSEDGASIYSASPVAREEFPNEDVTTRGAISIGRRLMDPLAELVKIDPKSIGVGQYQHDVDQSKLKHSLDQTVMSCVNQVGVNLNTASLHLLTYVSGLGPALARNIIDYRREHGPFTSRAQLKKVKRLGDTAYQQCAGFLRIPNAKNPLDNSAVHPESYHIVEQMAKDLKCTIKDLIGNKKLLAEIDVKSYLTPQPPLRRERGSEASPNPSERRGGAPPNLPEKGGVPMRTREDKGALNLSQHLSEVSASLPPLPSEGSGEATLRDILTELEKPGRDPRGEVEVFEFDKNVHTLSDLIIGMELPGIVTNITNFGAFVDIGVHQDGLVHISQLSDRFVTDPTQVIRLHQHVRVRVVEVDMRRKRIALSMKNIKQ
ncbi:RNA-binding transcriptional accessory protein [Prevotella melaninogenica]|uniref:RNA-binding transcriptional accessory protein n=1 Tax=Prevotella melaninogenica TaxID=28132 RepID=A0ABS6Y7F3_9BACT|nr:RNA-binding transcriptional accessory protein [Prevotella melaninogenica]